HRLLPMIGFALLERAGGLPLLALAAAAGGAAVLLAFLVPARRSFAALVGGAVLLAALVAVDKEFFEARGQMLGYLCFAVWLAVCRHTLAAGRVHPGHLVLGFAVAALWANTHPSFLVAVGLPLLFAAPSLLESRPP